MRSLFPFKTIWLLAVLLFATRSPVLAEDGYELWLRYQKVESSDRLTQYQETLREIGVLGEGPTIDAVRAELQLALPALLGKETAIGTSCPAGQGLVIGTWDALRAAGMDVPTAKSSVSGQEGFAITTVKKGGHPRKNGRTVVGSRKKSRSAALLRGEGSPSRAVGSCSTLAQDLYGRISSLQGGKPDRSSTQ